MRTFFYTCGIPQCSDGCSWQYCSHRYLARLRRQTSLAEISEVALRDGVVSLPGTTPRYGDVVIVYVANVVELDQMNSHKRYLECTRNLLVIGDPENIDGGRCHQLGPRFIAQAGGDVRELEAVINKMRYRMEEN